MLEVPRGLVLQQRLPGAALEGEGGRAQAALHQMGVENDRASVQWLYALPMGQSVYCMGEDKLLLSRDIYVGRCGESAMNK